MRFIAAITIALSSLLMVAQAQTKVELLPEVKALLEVQVPDDAAMKRNAYVAAWGLDAPKGEDYMAVGAQMVRQEFTFLQKIIEQMDYEAGEYHGLDYYVTGELLRPDFKVDGVAYKHPCEKMDPQGCIDETLAQQAVIEELLQRGSNAVIMERYLEMQKLPELHSYMFSVASPLPPMQNWVMAERMRMARATLAFYVGEADIGFQFLQEEVDFAKKVISGDSILIAQMIAIRQLARVYMLVNALMDEPFFKQYLHDPRLSALLQPLTLEEEKGKAQALENECLGMIYLMYALDVAKDSRWKNEPLYQATASVFYDNQMSANVAYLRCEPVVQRAALPLAQVSEMYVNNEMSPLMDLQQGVIKQQFASARENGEAFNPIGKILLDYAIWDYEIYLDRIYGVQIYLEMLSVKQGLLKEGVQKGDVAAYLERTGARNLFTQEPLQWDAESGCLSTSVEALEKEGIMRIFEANENNSELYVCVDLE